jgi:hypothetical protein
MSLGFGRHLLVVVMVVGPSRSSVHADHSTGHRSRVGLSTLKREGGAHSSPGAKRNLL